MRRGPGTLKAFADDNTTSLQRWRASFSVRDRRWSASGRLCICTFDATRVRDLHWTDNCYGYRTFPSSRKLPLAYSFSKTGELYTDGDAVHGIKSRCSSTSSWSEPCIFPSPLTEKSKCVPVRDDISLQRFDILLLTSIGYLHSYP